MGDGITFPIVNAGGIKASGIAFPVVGCVLVVLRFFSHRLKKTKPDLADLFGFISWLMIVGMGAVAVWSVHHGSLGNPPPADEPQVTSNYISVFQKRILQSEYFFYIFMMVALGTTKLSILFFFRQIFVLQQSAFWDYLTRALITIVSLWTLGFTLAYALQCGGHPSALWQPLTTYQRHCVSPNDNDIGFQKACAISDLVLDIACLTLPFPIIWRLKLGLRYKISVTGIFMVGLTTIGAGIARLVLWFQAGDVTVRSAVDVNTAVTAVLQWGMIETGLAFIASQLPALGPYLNKEIRHDLAKSVRQMGKHIRLADGWRTCIGCCGGRREKSDYNRSARPNHLDNSTSESFKSTSGDSDSTKTKDKSASQLDLPSHLEQSLSAPAMIRPTSRVTIP